MAEHYHESPPFHYSVHEFLSVRESYLPARPLAELVGFRFLSGGVIFGMIHENWDASEAVLFSVAALSTGGLVAPSKDDLSLWFTAWFTLLGVPLFGCVLACLAGMFEAMTRHAIRKEEIAQGFTDRERDMLRSCNVIGTENGISWDQFFEL